MARDRELTDHENLLRSEVSSIVSQDGLALRCTTRGEGPGVVLLHAGGETRGVWRPVARRLSAGGYRAVAVDQRGHGETRGEVPDRLEIYAQDVRALLRVLDTQVVVVGASLGGIALLLAMTDSQTASRVRAVVLVDVLPNPDPDRTRTYLRGLEPRAQRQLHRALTSWPLIEDILSRRDELLSATASLTVPLLVIRGSLGRIDSSAAERFTELVPSATFAVIPGAGHLVAHDCPNELADELLSFLARVETALP